MADLFVCNNVLAVNADALYPTVKSGNTNALAAPTPEVTIVEILPTNVSIMPCVVASLADPVCLGVDEYNGVGAVFKITCFAIYFAQVIAAAVWVCIPASICSTTASPTPS